MRTLVLTIAIGKDYQHVGEISHPTMKAYADKIGADFLVITETTFTENLPHWEKLSIFDLLTKYDRILYLDTDILVREDTPNVFEGIPSDMLGAYNEGRFAPDRIASLVSAAEQFDHKKVPIDMFTYYNTGVLVLARKHRILFKRPPKIFNTGYYEQDYINLQIIINKVKVKELPHRFNRMTIADRITGMSRMDSYFIHYAGCPDITLMENTMKQDLSQWEKEAPEYNFKKNIVVSVGGGLGDQVDTEPLIRYMKEVLYPNSKITVMCHWPEVFAHLEVDTMDNNDRRFFDKLPHFMYLETMPNEESNDVWKIVTHPLCHTLEFTALSSIHRVIPNNYREIKMAMTFEGIEEVNTIGNFSEYLLVHPGRFWETKTFPKEWWDKVISGLNDAGVKIAVVGKHISEEQGYVDVDIPEGVVDLRDLLSMEGFIAAIGQCRGVLSNDSAPIHIAGAFNPWIFLIATCKHEDYILPYRKGGQTYKACTFRVPILACDVIDPTPFEEMPKTIDKIKKGTIWDYLPKEEDVIEGILTKWRDEDHESVGADRKAEGVQSEPCSMRDENGDDTAVPE